MLTVFYAPYSSDCGIPDSNIAKLVAEYLTNFTDSDFYCSNSTVVDCFRAMLLTSHKHLIGQIKFYYLDVEGNKKLIPFNQSMRSEWYPEEYEYSDGFLFDILCNPNRKQSQTPKGNYIEFSKRGG